MKLFISYARVDKPLCKQIVEHLEDVHEVWYDRRLHAGQQWWAEIVDRLAWCEGFVYLLSPESVASEYCQREYAIAREAGKHIFPVLIQARTEVPASLSHIHYADLTQGMEDIITLMNALTVAERQQRRSSPAPIAAVPTAQPPADAPPSAALAQAADAMEAESFDGAVFILKQALEKKPTGRTLRILQQMLDDAETALERQTYLREASREYEPIAALVRRAATRAMGCQEFTDFRQQFPGYDPENLAFPCAEVGQAKPAPNVSPVVRHSSASRVYDLLPPPFEWLDIPAGQVELADGLGPFDVPAFQIAKYPLTNAQYGKFIEAGGYREKKWWTAAGWEAREQGWSPVGSDWKPTGTPWTEPRYWEDTKFNGAEQPVVGVSWYEAVAFCRWLSEISGTQVTLPSEQQWQHAAQGDDGRNYPFGDTWDDRRCNNRVSTYGNRSDRTTPVQKYEGKGDSPFGVVDMAGNVKEWCLTVHKDGSVDINRTDERVLRGGSWMCGNTILFLTYLRSHVSPSKWDNDIGFRCAQLAFPL